MHGVPWETGEEGAEMIKFLCDLCGKDISEKVHDSVKQFCGRTDFSLELGRQIMGSGLSQAPDTGHNTEHEHELVQLDLQLLAELCRLIHASAWGVRSPRMYCSNCALKMSNTNRSKVVTFFTRVTEQQCSAEMQ
jgi:hypothetical protein